MRVEILNIPRTATDLETLIRNHMRWSFSDVEKFYLDETRKRFQLHFYDVSSRLRKSQTQPWGFVEILAYDTNTCDVVNIKYTEPRMHSKEFKQVEQNRKDRIKNLIIAIDNKLLTQSGIMDTEAAFGDDKSEEQRGKIERLRVPNRHGNKTKWEIVYRLCRAQRDRGASLEDIAKWLEKNHHHLPRSPDTLGRLFAAGDLGLLTKNSSNIE